MVQATASTMGVVSLLDLRLSDEILPYAKASKEIVEVLTIIGRNSFQNRYNFAYTE